MVRPVQNRGQYSHGSSLACCSQALKYGLRTARGSTGGVSRLHSITGSTAANAASAEASRMIGGGWSWSEWRGGGRGGKKELCEPAFQKTTAQDVGGEEL